MPARLSLTVTKWKLNQFRIHFSGSKIHPNFHLTARLSRKWALIEFPSPSVCSLRLRAFIVSGGDCKTFRITCEWMWTWKRRPLNSACPFPAEIVFQSHPALCISLRERKYFMTWERSEIDLVLLVLFNTWTGHGHFVILLCHSYHKAGWVF